MTTTKWIGLGIFTGLALVLINWLYAKAKTANVADASIFGNPLRKMTIRNDTAGNGGFWKSRIGRYHEGVDLLCEKGETVFSPISGTIERKAYPYATDKRFEGCVIKNGTTEIKLFYMVCAKIGQKVEKGEVIGVCQAIATKYGGSMKNHLHIEIRQDNVLINPEVIYKIY